MKSIGLLEILNSIGSLKIKTIKIFDLIFGTLFAVLLKANPISNQSLTSINQILIIRPGGIGDAIFLLPFLRAIRTEHPNIQIDILCEKRNAEVFKSQENISNTIVCYDQFSEFIQIRNKTYDIIFDTEQWHYLSALVAYFIKSELKVGFATRPLRAKLFNKPIPYEIDGYEIDNFKNLFLPFFPSVESVKDIAESYATNAELDSWAGEKVKVDYLTLFLGASIALRRLSAEQCKSIIKAAFEKNLSVALLGGPDVADEGNKIVKEISDKRIINFTGQTSLAQTAVLIKRSKRFFGPDSGIMHLACAVGTPVTAIFGPGNVKKWGPKRTNDKIISLYVECSPCTRFGYTVPTCGGSYKCVRNITLNKILEFIK